MIVFGQPSLPGPTSFDFDHQGPTQEGADDDQQPEQRDIVQRGLQGYRSDDIPRHEKFQAQEQRLAQLVLVVFVRPGLAQL